MSELEQDQAQPVEGQGVVSEPVVDAEVDAKAEPEVDESANDVPQPEEIEQAIADAPVVTFYQGLQVLELLERVNDDGRECRMSDGTTMFVPLSVFGE